ncbi:hypothetical protein LSTR_LSTR017537 [Laodelphax striatellus]|uniref:Uncharacterized protein n=1 Tax=Laodelphax striatellus TaxID=195883 RepID=A0A482XE37_LAOST|nr:hypothetical protein LSTR_LSTR017537 [Laodelphax striatellus]
MDSLKELSRFGAESHRLEPHKSTNQALALITPRERSCEPSSPAHVQSSPVMPPPAASPPPPPPGRGVDDDASRANTALLPKIDATSARMEGCLRSGVEAGLGSELRIELWSYRIGTGGGVQVSEGGALHSPPKPPHAHSATGAL